MRLFFILLLTALASCAPSSKEKSLNSNANKSSANPEGSTAIPESEFAQFISLLPRVSLPFEVSCENCCDHPVFDRDHTLVKKYVPEGANLVGLIFKNERYAGILATYAADMLIPAVIVYDMSGKKADEKNFMTGYCGRDFDYEALQYFHITEDLSINAIDTLYSFAMDSVSQEIVDTLKREIDQKAYYIDANGRITEK